MSVFFITLQSVRISRKSLILVIRKSLKDNLRFATVLRRLLKIQLGVLGFRVGCRVSVWIGFGLGTGGTLLERVIATVARTLLVINGLIMY